jgi:hypothetical protein
MNFKLPSPNDMGNVVRHSLHRIGDLTVTEITEVMAEYFNQKSERLDSMVAQALRIAIGNWEASNGKGIL